MSPFPDSGCSKPRPRQSVSRAFLALLAVLLCGAGAPPVARPSLEDGLTLEGEIRGGEVHVYPVELQAGQFLRVFVQEDGIDIALHLLDPQGSAVAVTDSLGRGHAEEKEDLAALAERTGTYSLRVIAGGRDSGRYRLTVEGPRTPTEEDGVRAEAVKWTRTGMVEAKGSEEEQIQSLDRALALWQSLREARKSAEVFFARGKQRLALQQYDSALADLQQSAELWARQPDGTTAQFYRSSSLTVMGRCLRSTERIQEARKTCEQALALAGGLDAPGLQAENLNLLGYLDVDEGELRRGLGRQLEALELVRQAGDRAFESRILNNIADVYEQLGETQKALQYLQEALWLARGLSNQKDEVIYSNNLGDIYRVLGDWEKAFELYQHAAKLSHSAGKDRGLEAKVLINLAAAYRRHLGQIEQARKTLEQALAIGRELKSPEVQTFALVNLAALELEAKRPAEAVKHAREAATLGKSLEQQSWSHYALGRALRELGDAAAARTELEKALDLSHRRGDRGTEAEIGLALARVDRDRGDPSAALSRIRSSIELIESRRAGVVSPELRTSFLASKQDHYELQIDTLMALHSAKSAKGAEKQLMAEALRASEQARARGLLEILNESSADLRTGTDPGLIERERAAREELNARDWYRRGLLSSESPDPKKLAEAEHRLEEAIDEHQKVQVELREKSSRYAALTQPQPLDVAEIQRQVLDGQALLLEYALGAKRSYVWAVGPDSLASFELPERERIEKTARRYYELLTVRNNRLPGEKVPSWKKRILQADAEADKVARELSLLILQPVEKLLGDRPLLIVADGALQYIPFAALPVPSSGVPLMAQHEVVSLPSASALAVLRRELRGRAPAPRTLAIFADPVFNLSDKRFLPSLDKADRMKLTQKTSAQRGGDGLDPSTLRSLPFSQREADAISAFVAPGEVFKAVGFAASRATIAAGGLDRYRNVHFATHGFMDSHHPELSALVLSLYNEKGERQDGFLRLNDIYNLHLDADLVVLSACRTALGKEIRGEGLVGLTRGFMYAGASRVLASLWSVEDRATAELMGNLYRGMLREGLSPAAALRKAQLEMAKNPIHKSPYYWAGFSLQGEWR
jgi:CHAT domain-containing protein